MHYKKWHLAGLFFPCLPLYPRKLLLRTEILETFFDLHLRLKFSHCIILQRSPIFCLGAFLNFVFLLHYNVYWKIRWIGHAVFMVAFSMILHLTMVIPINTRTHTHIQCTETQVNTSFNQNSFQSSAFVLNNKPTVKGSYVLCRIHI